MNLFFIIHILIKKLFIFLFKVAFFTHLINIMFSPQSKIVFKLHVNFQNEIYFIIM